MWAWKRVVHHSAVGMIDLLHEAHRIGRAVEQVAFEAIEVFESQHHTDLLGVLGDLLHAFHAPLPFVRGGALTAEEAQGGVVGTDQRLGPGRLAAIECTLRCSARLGPARPDRD